MCDCFELGPMTEDEDRLAVEARFELGPMTEDEDSLAVEAQVRTLNILEDALNKKQWLLAEPGRNYGRRAADVPLICPQLVEDLIQTLQQVQLLKHYKTKLDDGVCSVYPIPSAPVIGLCMEFWKRHETLCFCSCPGTLIAAAACLLGYHDVDERRFRAEMEEHQRPKLRASRICSAFEVWMSHKGKYVSGSYTCCGEKSIHSVCEDSDMRFFLLCIMDEEQNDLAETSRKTTLKILLDARDKRLVVDDEGLIRQRQAAVTFPLITRNLLEELIKKTGKGDL
ncbi:uncharacterized protein LOC122945240 [Bufo gargarizans]|uniref:uncharacterized protein LOC122945240 n=1 Tax=Bufo gargarizans TaxID=30331 RepID=UPI001CF19870|nr:uncharacterized protein LOC122945240 [Bufo gargarizans]